jgi:hypothetical protein
MTTQMLETWEMTAKRLALELKAVRPSDAAPTARQRLEYRRLSYELQRHIEGVVE